MKKETYIEEKNLANMPKSIPHKVSKILGQMMETQICKIECKDGGMGQDFFVIFLLVGLVL